MKNRITPFLLRSLSIFHFILHFDSHFLPFLLGGVVLSLLVSNTLCVTQKDLYVYNKIISLSLYHI